MTNDTIIVSMTSWPKRIQFVAKAIFSITQQNVHKDLYHIVLVLCETEFPNREKDLPYDLQLMLNAGIFELLWTPVNTFSHKKLMPTLAKYPNNPILVTDEDMTRPQNWLSTFIKDHNDFPNDIIVGGCVFDIAFEKNKFNPVKRFGFDEPQSAGKKIIKRRPANGYGGVLYPAHIFTDKRFFDETLMLKLSRYSDESWQFCFNLIENRTIRWLSKIFPYHKGQQQGSMKDSMSNLRSKNKNDSYIVIYNNLLKEFPEFEVNLKERLK